VGEVSESGLDFYDRLVDRLLENGVVPVVTLYHWDLPLPLYERGGWRNRDTALAFADYAETVARRLGDRVRWWITQNEPWCSAYLGYYQGIHAPGLQGDAQGAVDVGHHLLLSHGLAIPRIRAHASAARIGAALNLFPIFAGDQRPETIRAVQRADRFHNRWFLEPLYLGEYPAELFAELGAGPPPVQADDFKIIGAPTDFLGVNYYNRWVIRGQRSANASDQGAEHGFEYIHELPHDSVTEMGWEVYPHGLGMILEELNRAYHPPALLITENGAAFHDEWDGDGRVADRRRVAYLRDHLREVERAIEHEAPVVGYFVWSLLDNFEWAQGYSKRFGLVYVDFETQRRIIKDSGRWYAGFIAGHRAGGALNRS
jgi:beta-glucosidase